MSPRYFATLIDEYDALEGSYAVMRTLPDRNLGDLPLVVISAGKLTGAAEGMISAKDQAAVTEISAELQADLATLSSNSEHLIAEDAAHYVHLDQPELVIDAIREVVDAVRQ